MKQFISKRWIALLCIVTMLCTSFVQGNNRVLAKNDMRLNKDNVVLYLNSDNVTKTKSLYQLIVSGLEKDMQVSYVSQNKAIAKVNNKGVITARACGKTEVLVIVSNANGEVIKTLPCKVTVKQNAKTVKITGLPFKSSMGINTPYSFQTNLIGKNGGTSTDLVQWEITDNKADAVVDKNGTVVAKKAGSFTLIAKTYQSKNALKKYKNKAYTATSTPITIKVLKDQYITNKDVKDGKVKLDDKKYGNLVISNTVGDAEILLNRSLIAGELKIESGADTKINVNNSLINSVSTIEPSSVSAMAIQSYGLDIPSIIFSNNAKCKKIVITNDINIEQKGISSISNVSVISSNNTDLNVNLLGKFQEVILDSWNAGGINLGMGDATSIENMSVANNNSNNSISSQTGSIQILDMSTSEKKAPKILTTTVSSTVELKISVEVKTAVVVENTKNASVSFEKPVGELDIEGSNITASIESSVGVLKSSGEKTTIAISATGSVTSATIEGSNTKVEGEGKIGTVSVSASKVEVKVEVNTVTVNEDANNVYVNGEKVTPGTTSKETAQPSSTPVNRLMIIV